MLMGADGVAAAAAAILKSYRRAVIYWPRQSEARADETMTRCAGHTYRRGRSVITAVRARAFISAVRRYYDFTGGFRLRVLPPRRDDDVGALRQVRHTSRRAFCRFLRCDAMYLRHSYHASPRS